MRTIKTTYNRYTVLVHGKGFVVLDRDGTPQPEVRSMSAARAQVRALRRAERERAA